MQLQHTIQDPDAEEQQVSNSRNKTEFREKRGEYREEQGCGPFGYFAIAVLKHHGSDNSEKEGLVWPYSGGSDTDYRT